jgi:hypothetical protein
VATWLVQRALDAWQRSTFFHPLHMRVDGTAAPHARSVFINITFPIMVFFASHQLLHQCQRPSYHSNFDKFVLPTILSSIIFTMAGIFLFFNK